MSNYGPQDPNNQGQPNGGFQPPNYGPPGGQMPPRGPAPQGPPPNAGGPYGGSGLLEDSTGFFGALFDFSFTHFITPKIVKLVYVLVAIFLALGAIGLIIGAFADNAGFGILALILGAIGYILYLALARMTLEFYLAIVRMSEDIHKRLR
jgi:hypothetical protein